MSIQPWTWNPDTASSQSSRTAHLSTPGGDTEAAGCHLLGWSPRSPVANWDQLPWLTPPCKPPTHHGRLGSLSQQSQRTPLAMPMGTTVFTLLRRGEPCLVWDKEMCQSTKTGMDGGQPDHKVCTPAWSGSNWCLDVSADRAVNT